MDLYVGGLDWGVEEKDLKELFKPYGVTQAKIIKDWNTGKSKGFGFVTIPDAELAQKAMQECNGRQFKGRNIRVNPSNKSGGGGGKGKQGKGKKPSGQDRTASPGNKLQGGGPENFPYRFCERNGDKEKLAAFHDRLPDGRYDVAFDIVWKTLTPTALNPCVDPDPKVSATMPENQKNELSGYNRRWLMVGNRMVISPFTVKSAIANGFANLVGGCYRVIRKEESHPKKVEDGQYYYKGGYKRYRVAMNHSLPGIIEELDVDDEGNRRVKIQPVIEYYLDKAPAAGVILKHGNRYFATTHNSNHKCFVDSVRGATGKMKAGEEELIYYGDYRFGRDLELKPGDLNKEHRYRFYKKKDDDLVSGKIPQINFLSEKELEGKVYMGKFKRLFPRYLENKTDSEKDRYDPRKGFEGDAWYENLNKLHVDHWVYYQSFTDPKTGKEVVTHIGKNFQFKALFFHEDAVPDDHALCRDLDQLCPRCRMFGMTNDESKKKVVGLKGRFKASGLVHDAELTPAKDETISIPDVTQKVSLKQWIANGKPAAYQVLLPISGPPKPNKRDVDGYFEKGSGLIRGAKVYKHAELKDARNIHRVDSIHEKDYTHRLRNYAMVSEPELSYKGTVGAENCSLREIAALVLLLNSELSGHGFKIGLGKAFGMGSVKSSVVKAWVRKREAYDAWESAGVPSADALLGFLEAHVKGVKREAAALKAVTDFKERINGLEGRNGRALKYPLPNKDKNPGRRTYWKIFNTSLGR